MKRYTIVFNALAAQRGGALIVYKAILSSIWAQAQGWRIVVLVGHERAVREYSSIGDQNLEVHNISGGSSVISTYLQPLTIRKACAAFEADLVVSQNYYVPLLPCPQLVYHVNVFNFIRNEFLVSGSDRVKQWIRMRLCRWALRFAAVNVFESHYLFDASKMVTMQRRGEDRVVYIGVNEQNLVPPAVLETRPAPEAIIVVVSSINPHKRNWMLVEVLDELVKLRPDIEWRIQFFGSVGSESDVESIVSGDRSDILAKFTFSGYVDQDAMQKSLDRSLCLLCTSAVESFCTVAVEAMNRGIPAIVTPHTSMPESVGKAGYVAHSDSAEEIAKEVISLFTDRVYYNQRTRESHSHASRLTWSSAGESFRQIFQILEARQSDG